MAPKIQAKHSKTGKTKFFTPQQWALMPGDKYGWVADNNAPEPPEVRKVSIESIPLPDKVSIKTPPEVLGEPAKVAEPEQPKAKAKAKAKSTKKK